MAATAFQDYYATLGVPKTATQKEIKAAFRRLARTHHPDLNANNPEAERRFKEINEAHEVLGDPEKRKRYDEVGPRYREYEQWERAGRPGPNPFAGGAPGGFAPGGGDGSFQYRTVTPEEMESLFGDADPFSHFFHSMFGRAGGSRTRRATVQRRGEDVEGEVEVTLEEAYAGTTRTVEMSGPSGTRRVEVRIPQGIGDGALVRAAGQGGAGSGGGSAGDLRLRVRIAPHPRFQREGADLRCRVPVPLDVALLGGEVAVPTLRGTTAQLHVPAGTQSGARLRLRGLGMPRLRGGTHGDLYAEVDVRLPATLSPAARGLAEQLRRERLG